MDGKGNKNPRKQTMPDEDVNAAVADMRGSITKAAQASFDFKTKPLQDALNGKKWAYCKSKKP